MTGGGIKVKEINPKTMESKLVKNNPGKDYAGDFKARFDEKKFGYPCLYLKEPMLPVSSTQIRGRILENRSFKYLIPPAVYDYIKEHKLYINLENQK